MVKGIVQGVGFRPFIYKIALENKLAGWVLNDSDGVTIEVEGNKENTSHFLEDIRKKHPALAVVNEILILNEETGITKKYVSFTIRESFAKENRQTLIAPDNNVCDDCLKELFDKNDRRYTYPFINCTNCGPRYSIIEDMPYDRKNTTMKQFKMCDSCNAEFTNPLNRRFHAQPNACFECGPKLSLVNNKGKLIVEKDVIEKSVALLKKGKILAVKGIGGFHLVADPLNAKTVNVLRTRKNRKYKPLALMSESLDDVKTFCEVSLTDEELLESKERPIILLRKKSSVALSKEVAPNDNYLGVMLAYTPVHYLLLKNNFKSLIFTSGNMSDEPIIFKNDDAIKYLGDIADFLLIHDREIYIRLDDSIARNIEIEAETVTQIFRRGRGYTPKPLTISNKFETGLALGSELKNTICLNRGGDFFLSQHIGDLKNQKIYNSQKLIIEHFKKMLEISPKFIATDMHPGFLSTRNVFEQKDLPVIQVQHHHAHMASCMFENNLDENVIGIVFDGVGYGLDGNSWGSEFLVGNYKEFKRIGHFSYFKLLGSDQAVKEPYRIALSLLFDSYKDQYKNLNLKLIQDTDSETLDLLYKMHAQNINTPLSCGMGRIFDAVSSLLGIRSVIEYEGQAAIELEQAIKVSDNYKETLEYMITEENGELIINSQYLFKNIVEYILKGSVDQSKISQIFHNTIGLVVGDMAEKIREKTKLNKVILSGGVFQNMYLTLLCLAELKKRNFDVYIHKNVPPNDGGISLGQLIVALNQRSN